jgi:hypothetical protein
MEFLNPLFLIGLLSAAVPLIIHLSRSRRTKKIRFSTTRFLTDQFLRSYRMSRLKELLLLASRMALCALFAMALAQPFLRPKGQLLWGDRNRSIVFVIDNSASMGYRDNGVTLLEQAQDAAHQLANGMNEGDRASIVLAGRRAAGPEILFHELTPETGDIRQAIDSIVVSGLGTDLSQAVVSAERLVTSGSAESSRELYVFSDLQETGWEMLDEAEDVAGAADTNLFFVNVRPESPRNLAVTAVQFAASRPMVGLPFTIRPHVRNQNEDVVDCDVELFVDGKKVGERQIESLQSGRWSVPTFHHTFDSGGWHSGYVQVQDDTLDADNRRYFAFEVLDSINVLALNGAPSAVGRLDELFFLQAALAAGSTRTNPINVDVVRSDGFLNNDLGNYPLVIMANVESLPSPAVEKLESFVDQGGSLLVFLGDKTNPSFYNQTFTGSNRLHGGLLPGKLAGVQGNPSAETYAAHIGETDGTHVVLAAFDEGEAGNLASVGLKALWDFDPGDSTVLMRTNAGSPLLCERGYGQGHVMLFGSTCDRDWTNFPVRPAFLPWIYRLVGYLCQEPMARRGSFRTGDTVSAPVSATEGLSQWLIKKPDGTIGHFGTSNDPTAPLAFGDTSQTGVYTMYSAGKTDESQLFVANLEAYESDLTYLDDVLADRDAQAGGESPQQFAARDANIERGLNDVLLPGRPLVSFVNKPANVVEASLTARQGVRLWDLLLWMALLVALFEPWFANRISLRHYLKRPDPLRVGTVTSSRWRADNAVDTSKQPAAERPSESNEPAQPVG